MPHSGGRGVIDLRRHGPSTGQQIADIGQSVLQFFLQREQLDLRKDALKQRQKEFEFQQEQQQIAEQGRRQQVLNTLIAARQGDPAAQQTMQQLPELQQAAAGVGDATKSLGQALGPARAAATRPSPGTASRLEATRAAAQANIDRKEAVEGALNTMQRIAAEEGDPSIVQRARAAIALENAGLDASVIRETLPPTAKEALDLQKLRINIASAQNDMQADNFATAWLKQQGLLHEEAPLVPGAAETMQSVIESREGEQINWAQEGLDFITSRVGDSASGSAFGFTLGPDGTLIPASDEAVTVEEAVGEWQGIVERFAPPQIRESIGNQIREGLFQRRATRRIAIGLAEDIFRRAADQNAAAQAIRSALEGQFSEAEINSIVADARKEVFGSKRLER